MMYDEIFRLEAESGKVGMRVRDFEDGRTAIAVAGTGRLLEAQQTAELRDALVLHTLGEDLAARVQALIAGGYKAEAGA